MGVCVCVLFFWGCQCWIIDQSNSSGRPSAPAPEARGEGGERGGRRKWRRGRAQSQQKAREGKGHCFLLSPAMRRSLVAPCLRCLPRSLHSDSTGTNTQKAEPSHQRKNRSTAKRFSISLNNHISFESVMPAPS